MQFIVRIKSLDGHVDPERCPFEGAHLAYFPDDAEEPKIVPVEPGKPYILEAGDHRIHDGSGKVTALYRRSTHPEWTVNFYSVEGLVRWVAQMEGVGRQITLRADEDQDPAPVIEIDNTGRA